MHSLSTQAVRSIGPQAMDLFEAVISSMVKNRLEDHEMIHVLYGVMRGLNHSDMVEEMFFGDCQGVVFELMNRKLSLSGRPLITFEKWSEIIP